MYLWITLLPSHSFLLYAVTWTGFKSNKIFLHRKSENCYQYRSTETIRVYYIEWTLTKWVLSQNRELQLEYASLGSAIMFECRVHLYLQFLLQLVHLYSMNHILQAEMLFFWQKIFIPREHLMSALWFFSMLRGIR